MLSSPLVPPLTTQRRMRIQQLALTLVCFAGGIACSRSTEPSQADPLVGRWTTDQLDLSPAGSMQNHLTFSVDGGFVAEHRSYGVYPGQRADDPSAYSRTFGTYVVEGIRLHFTPEAIVSWDHFYGPNSAERIQVPYPYGELYPDARFELDGRVLTLRFLIYPADAPVPTFQTFRLDR